MTPYDLLMMIFIFLGYDINTGKGNAALSWAIFFITLNIICYKLLFKTLVNDIKKRIMYQLLVVVLFEGISLIILFSIENKEIIMLIFLLGAIVICGIYNILEIRKLINKKKKGIGECLGELSIMLLGIYIVCQSIDRVRYEGPDYTYGVMIALGVVGVEAVMAVVIERIVISSQKSNEILRLKEEEQSNEMYYKGLEERYMCSSKVIDDIRVQLKNLREQSERKKNTEALKYIDLLEEQVEIFKDF